MDWNSNTLLFLETISEKPKYCYHCRDKDKCICGVELNYTYKNGKNIRTENFETFYEYIETFPPETLSYYKTITSFLKRLGFKILLRLCDKIFTLFLIILRRFSSAILQLRYH